VVAGLPGNMAGGAAPFLAQAATVMTALHRHVATAGAGEGWTATPGVFRSNSTHLSGQLSPRVQTMPWWQAVAETLRSLDDQPSVYLHGDLKPEHILTSHGVSHVVDWEACGRGPAACDHADTLFHLLRDQIYAGDDLYPVPRMETATPGLAPVLAWRLIQWADRRREDDLARLPGDTIVGLAGADDGAAALSVTAAIIADMRGSGTPR